MIGGVLHGTEDRLISVANARMPAERLRRVDERT